MKDIDLDNLPAGMPAINLKSAVSNKQEKPLGLNLAERIYRLQVIKQLIRERHMAHSAEEYNESKYWLESDLIPRFLEIFEILKFFWPYC